MKKMNVISLFLSLFLLASCSHQEQLIEDQTELETAEKESKNREQEVEYLSAIDVYLFSVELKMSELNNKLAELLAQLEAGNEEVLAEIESTQEDIERHSTIQDYFLGIIGPMGPVPILRPPLVCNCLPLPSIRYFVLGNSPIESRSTIIKNSEGEIVGRGSLENVMGVKTIMLEMEEEFERGVLHSIIVVNGIEIRLETPVEGTLMNN